VLSGVGAIVACSSPSQSTGTSSEAAGGIATAMATPAWAKSGAFVGRVNESTTLTVQVHLRMHNEAAAEAQLADVSNPESPNYRHFLSDDEFASKYGATASDVATVRAHFEGHGLTVSDLPANNAYVTFTGTASQFEAAFGTQLGQYKVGTDTRRAPMTAAVLPAQVGAAVSGVLGLATPAKMKSQRLTMADIVRKTGAAPADVSPSTCSTYYGQILDTTDPAFGGGFPADPPYAGCGYKPGQLRQGYGLDTEIRRGNDGTGQTIAIVDAFTSPTLVEDAQTYAAAEDPDYPLAKSQIKLYAGPGTTGQPIDTGWYGEQTLDVETVHAMAPGAKIAFVGAQSANDVDLIGAINMIVTKHLATLVSNSYSSFEDGGGDFTPWQAIATQAGLKGIGLYFATGDSGVGATSLALGRTNNVLFQVGWETAVSFLTAPTLEDGGPDPDGGAPTWQPAAPGEWYFGGGGGQSALYVQPSWQKGVVPSSLSLDIDVNNRVIPDVSMLGDPMTGFLVGETDPQSGTYSEEPIGGTSLATPMFTATMALAQQYAGKTFGSANAAIYKAAKSGGFSDVAPGKLEATAIPGGVMTTFDYHGPENSNATAKGFDAVTGLGVPNGTKFLSAMK
jgi:subtilase family serine protease